MKASVRTLLVILSITGTSATAHDLKAELQAIAPSGQIIRLVYAKGGLPQEDNGWGNFSSICGPDAIYCVSSEDGVIRKVYPAGNGTGNYHCVNITRDGTRIVFWDASASQIVVVNWDGTGARTIDPANYSATGMYDYYYDAGTNTDWALLSDDNTFVRVNIDQPAAPPVTVATSTQVGGWYPADDIGGTISDDGRYLCGDNGSGTKGIIDLSSASRRFVNGATGCHVQVRPGTPVEFSQNDGRCASNCTCNGSDEHRGPNIFNTSGARTGFHCVSDAIKTVGQGLTLSGCQFLDRADGLRWLRNRNYFSQMVYGNFGPVLWRTTDNKWTYIEHDVPCTNNTSSDAWYKNIYMGDMDGQTAASFPGATTVSQYPVTQPASASAGMGDAGMYSLDGRLVAPTAGLAFPRGVVIRKSKTGITIPVVR